MRRALFLLLLLTACQSQPRPQIYLWDGATLYTLQAQAVSPAQLAAQIGAPLNEADRVLLNGKLIPADTLLPADNLTLQIRRAVAFRLITPTGEKTIRSAAPSLGQALRENGYTLYAQDFLAPPAATPLTDGLRAEFRPSRPLTITVGGRRIAVRSAAQSVGQALAEAGMPLLGLDSSLPAESAPLPADGEIQILRQSEILSPVLTSIPFQTQYVDSADLPLGVEDILQPGAPGVALRLTRIRLVDGIEIRRAEEAERALVPPQDRISGRGTQISLQTLNTPGGPLQYWRAISMYATSYSPCRSGVPGRCFSGTASGLPVQRGVVAFSRAWYNQLAGARVYIPGYGAAVVADVGGGFPDGRAWIDLGYSDADWQEWSGWVTVYFLAPAPASIPYFLK
ncbi:MAG: hypothetical protein Fur0035_16500 [Anaerolineales bacterium]